MPGARLTMLFAILFALANYALLAAAGSSPNLGRILTHDEGEIMELHHTSVHHSAPHFDERRGDWREFPVDVSLSVQAPTLGKNWHLRLTRAGHTVLPDDAQVKTQDGPVDHLPHVNRAYRGVEEHDGRWTRVTFLPDGAMHAVIYEHGDLHVVDSYLQHETSIHGDHFRELRSRHEKSKRMPHVVYNFHSVRKQDHAFKGMMGHLKVAPKEFIEARKRGLKPAFELKAWNILNTDSSGSAMYIPTLTGCESNVDSGGNAKYSMWHGVAIDYGFTEAAGGVSNALAEAIAMYNDINIIYGRQFGVVLHLKYVEIRTGFTAEDWNDKPNSRYSGNNRATGQCTNGGHDSTSACNDGISNSLNQLGEWRLNSAPDAGLSNDKKAGLWHLLTDCYPSGTVGLAWKGVPCNVGGSSFRCVASGSSTSYIDWEAGCLASRRPYGSGTGGFGCSSGTGVTGRSGTTWLTLGHEIGHNMGADHNQGQYTQNSMGDGIMSYNDNYPSNHPLAYQFKHQRFYDAATNGICREISDTKGSNGFNGQLSGSQCYKPVPVDVSESGGPSSTNPSTGKTSVTFSGNAPQCGNGIVDEGEDCDTGSGSDACCTNQCQFVSGGNCLASDGECCDASTCRIKPASTVCSQVYEADYPGTKNTNNGYCGNRFCHVVTGFYEPCYYSNYGPINFSNDGCKHQCGFPGSTNAWTNNGGNPLYANQNRWNAKEGSRCGTNGAGTCTASGTCEVVLQYSWQTGAWGDCLSPCGSAGTQTRTVTCVNQAGSTVSDSNCDAGSKPAESQACNTQSCPQWTIGNFGACSAACGGGTRSRSVVCTEDGTTVADTVCTNCNGNGCPGTKPAATEACNTASCPTFSTGSWSSCTEACGGGTQTRTVECKQDGSTVADSVCTAVGLSKPSEQQACNTSPCPSSPAWYTGTWGACSAGCGGGSQTRSVQCQQDGSAVAESLCTGTKPVDSRACNVQACPTWEPGSWGACNSPCGGGQRTRVVSCVQSGSTVADSVCIAAAIGTKPAVTEACNTQTCPEISVAPPEEGDILFNGRPKVIRYYRAPANLGFSGFDIYLYKDTTRLFKIKSFGFHWDSTKEYTWNVPDASQAPPGTGYFLRVYSTLDANKYGVSGNFTIAATPSIAITSPKTVRTLTKGSALTVEFTATNVIGGVRADLVDANSLAYVLPIATKLSTDVWTQSTHTVTWVAPQYPATGDPALASGGSSFPYKIQIKSLQDSQTHAETEGIRLIDPSTSGAASIAVLQPTSATQVRVGETIKIQYSSLRDMKEVNMILYSGVVPVANISASGNLEAVPNSGFYEWVVPNTILPGHGYYVHVQAVLPDNSIVQDRAGPFDILVSSPFVFVDSPTWHFTSTEEDFIGEDWRSFDLVEIKHTSGNLPAGKEEMEIHLQMLAPIGNGANAVCPNSLDDQGCAGVAAEYVVAASVNGSSSFKYRVPPHIPNGQTRYRLRIRSKLEPSILHYSKNFGILKPSGAMMCGDTEFSIVGDLECISECVPAKLKDCGVCSTCSGREGDVQRSACSATADAVCGACPFGQSYVVPVTNTSALGECRYSAKGLVDSILQMETILLVAAGTVVLVVVLGGTYCLCFWGLVGPNKSGPASSSFGSKAYEMSSAGRGGSVCILPPGWEKAKTPEGETYYANRQTGESSWSPPPHNPIGQGNWREVTSSSGERYSWNPVTQETQWKM